MIENQLIRSSQILHCH